MQFGFVLEDGRFVRAGDPGYAEAFSKHYPHGPPDLSSP
jgi:hypothetical protein